MSTVAATGSVEVVGRDGEIASLRDFLSSLEDGAAALVLEGEAGIGKTTLLRAGLTEAAARGHAVLGCRPDGAEAGLSFAALADLLEGVDDAVLTALPEPQRRALRVAVLAEEAGESPPDRRAVGVGFLHALRALAAIRPVVVAVDDVQWLDGPSARVLEFAARRLGAERIGLLLAARTSSLEAGVPFGLERALADERLRRLEVGPLSIGALHELLRTRLGDAISRPALRRVHAFSGGNPFYALEIARGLARRGLWPEVGDELPLSGALDALVRDRLGALPPDARELVRVVSALAAPTPAQAELVLGADCSRLLDAASEAHVLEVDDERIRFTHPLIAHAAYRGMRERERRELHRRLAELPAEPEERARHLALAADGPDPALARIVAEAARHAAARGAPEAAAELAERARALTPTEDDEARRDLALEAAGYRVVAGHTAEARELLEEALATTPPGPFRAHALTEVARISMIQTDPELALEFVREAIRDAGEHCPVRSRAEEFLALLLCNLRQDLPEAADHARKAAELAEAAGDGQAAGSALGTQAWAEILLGRSAADATLARALALVRPASVQWVINDPRYTLAVRDALRDEFAAARALFVELEREAAERGEQAAMSLLLVHRGIAAWLAGDLVEASACADEAAEEALAAGQRSNEAAALSVRALVAAQLGHADEAAAAAAEALDLWRGVAAWAATVANASSALALLALARDDAQSAYGHLSDHVERARRGCVGEPGAMRFVPDAIEALVALDRAGEAEELLDWFEAHARRLDRASALARCHTCRGLLAAATGDHRLALSAFGSALVEHDRGTVPLERARTLLALGTTQRRAKQKRAARESLERAAELFEKLSAPLWAERARAELARIGGRTSTPHELTPTEARVAELVAEGKTNREVAAVLYVSHRTVEANLSRVYRKLGIRSRSELTRLLAGEHS